MNSPYFFVSVSAVCYRGVDWVLFPNVFVSLLRFFLFHDPRTYTVFR